MTASFIPLQRTPFEVRVDVASRQITLIGELDVAAAAELAVAVVTLQFAGPGDILIRLGELEFMDMAGLGAIIGARNAQQDRQAALVMTGATARVRRLFDMAGLGDLLDTA